MSGRYVLDTNIVIALFAQDAAVLNELTEAQEVFVPSVVLGELYYGARKSAHPGSNVRRIDEFAGRSAVLLCDVETARQYGRIKDVLRAKGRPLPENDIWVAAGAKQHGLTLVSRDSHFGEISDLDFESW